MSITRIIWVILLTFLGSMNLRLYFSKTAKERDWFTLFVGAFALIVAIDTLIMSYML